MSLKAIILAAGKGTRMKSQFLKVLHTVAGKPIVEYVIDAVREVGIKDIFLVVGHQKELVEELTKGQKVRYVVQEEQLGTGHAVQQVVPSLKKGGKDDTILILAGDCPLISPETLENLIAIHHESNAAGTILTTKMQDPDSYGRILRGEMGTVIGIREAKDCTKKELLIKEINTGIYCFQQSHLMSALGKLTNKNKQKEYYLTDVIEILKYEKHVISAYCANNPDEALGVNTRIDQAKVNRIIYSRNNQHFMREGVTIIDPETTFIDSTVHIGYDSIVYPFTMILGDTQIGHGCKIGPNSYIQSGKIKPNTHIPPFTHIP